MTSLSARLLLLTVIFVMLAEILIFVPSVARFRITYLNDRLEAAHLAMLVLDAAPDGMVSEDMSSELLTFVDAHAVAARRGDLKLSLMMQMPPPVENTIFLGEEGPIEMTIEAFRALFYDGNQVVRLVGPSPKEPSVQLDVLMDEGPLCGAIQSFAVRIFWLSLAISVLTAGMVFLVLRRQLVRPLKRLSRNMVRFRGEPEDRSRVIRLTGRKDELGIAERELAAMQTAVQEALTQRRHLAALGTAVAKINHDLRGILSSALIVSDRLETSEDPEVRRIAPGLLDAIDRAVDLCSRTLSYVGHDVPTMDLGPVPLRDVVSDAAFGLQDGTRVQNRVARDITIHADRTQVFRIFNNLFRNAAQAGCSEIQVEADFCPSGVKIRIGDNGPGLPPRALENLFKPFEGSGKAGGTGLGLSIARDLARAHGGDMALMETGAAGTRFEVTLPEKGPSDDHA